MSMKPYQTVPAPRAAGVRAAHLPVPQGGDEGASLQPDGAARGGTLRRWIDGIAGAFRQPSAWAHTVWADTEWASTLVLPGEVRADAASDADAPAPH